MPRMTEINGGIHICGKRLKTRLKTLFSFLNFFVRVDQKFCNWAKNMPMVVDRLGSQTMITVDERTRKRLMKCYSA